MEDKSFLENSIFYKKVRKTLLSITDLTLASARKTEKYFDNFKNMQMIGAIVISAVLVNLFLIQIMRKEVQSEWVVYRCVIALIFIPWILFKGDLKKVARDSKLLKVFYRK